MHKLSWHKSWWRSSQAALGVTGLDLALLAFESLHGKLRYYIRDMAGKGLASAERGIRNKRLIQFEQSFRTIDMAMSYAVKNWTPRVIDLEQIHSPCSRGS